MELKIDKLNGEMAFNDAEHKYWNTKYPDRKYTSVTTLIGKYHEEFDSEFWSSYKALESLMGVDEFAESVKRELLSRKKFDLSYVELNGIAISEFEVAKLELLKSYDKTRDDACERGTAYHNMKENAFYEKDEHEIGDYNFGLDLPGKFVCAKNDFSLNKENCVLPEYLIYFSSNDGILNIAGQIDVVVKQGNDIYILDYKTNAKGIEMKSYFNPKTRKSKMMFYPLNDIQDCAFQHYTLQLSLYAYMLQRINPEFNIKMLRICHIDGEGVETLYDLEYKKDHVIKLLKDYKKVVATNYHRETGKFL